MGVIVLRCVWRAWDGYWRLWCVWRALDVWVWIDMGVEGLGWVRGYLKRSGRSRVGMERLGWVYMVWGR